LKNQIPGKGITPLMIIGKIKLKNFSRFGGLKKIKIILESK
jgi:hypothetical protein